MCFVRLAPEDLRYVELLAAEKEAWELAAWRCWPRSAALRSLVSNVKEWAVPSGIKLL
jgi:hypothetical protein